MSGGVVLCFKGSIIVVEVLLVKELWYLDENVI